jgi:hypothetical protein
MTEDSVMSSSLGLIMILFMMLCLVLSTLVFFHSFFHPSLPLSQKQKIPVPFAEHLQVYMSNFLQPSCFLQCLKFVQWDLNQGGKEIV